MARLFNLFYKRLPVGCGLVDEHLHLLNKEEIRRIRRSERLLMTAAAGLSLAGFLAYYLPIYKLPHLFPSLSLVMPVTGSVKLLWGELLWCVLLVSLELVLLTLLNIAGVHEIAAATGFINERTKAEKEESLLRVGLEKKSEEVIRYGIDPFQGLDRRTLFLFNIVLRLKGWLASKVIRYLLRALLGRYAVRAALDFSGLPLYMAINAYSVHKVLREARVIILGQTEIALLLKRLPQWTLSAEEKELLYDTLQYIAISKRDFHQNHYLLTKYLMEFFSITPSARHPLPDDYLDRLIRAPFRVAALCRAVIILGFLLDGNLSGRERRRLRELNHRGAIEETAADVKRYMGDFLSGAGMDGWTDKYLSRMAEASFIEAGDSL